MAIAVTQVRLPEGLLKEVDSLVDKGARKFIQKPYQMQLLLDTVREVLDLKEDR